MKNKIFVPNQSGTGLDIPELAKKREEEERANRITGILSQIQVVLLAANVTIEEWQIIVQSIDRAIGNKYNSFTLNELINHGRTKDIPGREAERPGEAGSGEGQRADNAGGDGPSA